MLKFKNTTKITFSSTLVSQYFTIKSYLVDFGPCFKLFPSGQVCGATNEGYCTLSDRLSSLRWEFIKENKNSTKKAIKKTRKKEKNFLFFLITFLVEFLFSFFFSCFLPFFTFLFSFINFHLRRDRWILYPSRTDHTNT